MGEAANTKKTTLSEFARRAYQRMQDKKVTRYVTLHAPDLDDDIKFRNLWDDELVDTYKMQEGNDDPNYSEKYAIYTAAVEPNLKAAAQELIAEGKISTPMEIMDTFSMREVLQLAKQVMEHSEAMGGESVRKVTKELKNSSGETDSQT